MYSTFISGRALVELIGEVRAVHLRAVDHVGDEEIDVAGVPLADEERLGRTLRDEDAVSVTPQDLLDDQLRTCSSFSTTRIVRAARVLPDEGLSCNRGARGLVSGM